MAIAKRKPAPRSKVAAKKPAPKVAVNGAAKAEVKAAARPAARPAAKPATKPVAAPKAPAKRPPEPRKRAEAASSGRGKYVYCVIRASGPREFGAIGLGTTPTEVHTIHYKNIAAVVSDTPIEVHEPTRENVLAHERVNETVMHQVTVIPMSFGTVFNTREDILELLRSAYDAFDDVLDKMQDKLEFGVKALWDPAVMIEQIEREDEDVRRLKSEISTQKGSTYFARMQYGRLIDQALQARSERYVNDIFGQLSEVSVASRANKPIGDKMIMNGAFLVARDKESEFDAKVKAIGARYEKLTFKYTGPWPPYNFVNIRLKLERAKEGG